MIKKFRYIKCNLCNSKDSSRMFKVGNSFLVKCKKCGFVFLNPILTEKELKKYYDNSRYFDIQPIDKSPIEYERSLERLNLIKKYVNVGKILDVGSGGSNFLFIAKQHGWDTYSIEIREQVKELHKKYSIRTIDENKIPNGFFDAITLSQVLEHMPNPFNKLKIYYDKLVSGGIIVIEVPNVESLASKLFKDKWYFIKNPEHISYFSKITLSKILRKSGFQIIKIEYLGATLVTDLISMEIIEKDIIFYVYRYFKLPLKFLMRIFNILGLSDTLRIVARKPV